MMFFFNDTATTEIYTLSLHDALPIFRGEDSQPVVRVRLAGCEQKRGLRQVGPAREPGHLLVAQGVSVVDDRHRVSQGEFAGEHVHLAEPEHAPTLAGHLPIHSSGICYRIAAVAQVLRCGCSVEALACEAERAAGTQGACGFTACCRMIERA